MTLINSKDLDAQMGRHIDPNSVPKHDGTGTGHMEAVIQRGSDQVITEQGGGKRGAAVYNAEEVGGQDFFGSKTIISVNDAPPLPTQMDPLKLPVVPQMPKPAAAPPVAVRARTPAELLAQMGLGKKP